MSEATIQHLMSLLLLLSYKIAALTTGYLFVKLGYKLLVKGISGDFKFSAEYKGVKADVVSASPGIFFILMGTIIVGIALYKGVLIDSAHQQSKETSIQKQEVPKEGKNKPYLPEIPPMEERHETKHDAGNQKVSE
jgi:hypothetical protein